MNTRQSLRDAIAAGKPGFPPEVLGKPEKISSGASENGPEPEATKCPLAPVALWFAAGILVADRVEAPLAGLFAAAFGIGLLALVWEQKRWLLLALLLFLAGWLDLACRDALVSPCDLRALVGERTEIATVRGKLAGPASRRVIERDEEDYWHTLNLVEVEAVRLDRGDWQPATGTVQATTKGCVLTNLFEGQAVEVTGVLSPPPGPLAEGLFDYRTYLARQGIRHLLRVDSEGDWRVLGATNPPPWTERFRLWAQATLARGLPEVDEPLKLQWAMVLGWKTALTGEVSEPFMKSGTMHIFAISGLHIALVAGILMALLRVIEVPRLWCGLVVIPLIWFYTAATEWQASAIRSTVMMTIIIGGWALKRPSNLINSLAAAAFAILAWDPAQLVQASFQLSFGAVLGIAVLMPGLDRFRVWLLRGAAGEKEPPGARWQMFAPADSVAPQPVWPDHRRAGQAGRRWFRGAAEKGRDRIRRLLLLPDPLLPEDLWPWWRKRVARAENRIMQAASVSIAATLGTAPLIALYFHLITPVSIISNLLVVPLSGLALMCGMGSIICGAWPNWFTEWFNHAGWFFMLAMVKISKWSVAVPGAFIYVRSPAWVTIGVYYVGLAALLKGWCRGRHGWKVAAGLGAALVTAIAWEWHDRTITRVTLLPLGGGDAVWLEAPGRDGDWLIDCGDTSAAERVTLPFLHARGVDRLAHLVLTHGDVRHVGGGLEVADQSQAEKLLTGPLTFRSAPYRQVLSGWRARHRTPLTLKAGDAIPPWHVLHPQATDRFAKADDGTLVLRGEIEGTRLLFCSDLAAEGQNRLLQRGGDLRADIVVAGLPAETEPLHDALLDAIQPSLIVIADDDRPAKARATDRLVLRLNHRRVPVLFLREARAVTIEFHRGEWKASTMDGKVHRGGGRAEKAPGFGPGQATPR